MRIAITAAEASGDRAAGQLAAALKHLRPDVEIYGSGGKWLREAGGEVIVDASGFGVVGIASALASLPKLLTARKHLLAELKRRPPDVLVPIDAGAFHLGFGPIQGLLLWTRQHLPQTKICYYFPPSSWRKTLKYTPLVPLTDAVATPFPWNASELTRLGVNATFVGHPLLDLVKPSQSKTAFCAAHGLDPNRPIVGLLPGSRKQELEAIYPTQLAATALISREVPGAQFVVALAATVDPSSLPTAPNVTLVASATYEVMAHADALICTSGTATLEAAILGTPLVIVYKMHPANKFEYLFVKNKLPEHIGMPNLLAGKRIAPELIQDAATPQAIASEIVALLTNTEQYGAQKDALAAVVKELGTSGGAERTAQLILELN